MTNRTAEVGEEKELAIPDIEFPVEMENSEVIEVGREIIARARSRIVELSRTNPARSTCKHFTRFHDVLLKALYRHMLARWDAEGKGQPGSLCLAAVGGYARRDVCLHSDIDLMFFLGDRGEGQEEFIKSMLHILFDWKLDISHAVRRAQDCVAVVGTDLESATTIMEGRYLAGSRPLFQHVTEVFHRALRGGGRRWFLQSRLEEWKARREKHDASVYHLQPNLKEGAGGLRDVHTIRWLLQLQNGSGDLGALEKTDILSGSELKRLRRAEEFVIKLRNGLHTLLPRKSEILTFDAQLELARRFSYSATDTALAEEVLMRDYYRRARDIDKFTSRALAMILRSEKSTLGSIIGTLRRRRLDKRHLSQDGVIYVDDKYPTYLEEDPRRIMTLFARARRLGLRVSERTRDTIERIVPAIDDEFRQDAKVKNAFLEILRGPAMIARTIEDMHDCGFLSAYIPEFERVHYMVRMDYYHRYTVDEHLIKAVEVSEQLGKDPPAMLEHAALIASEIERTDLLNLSLLLHDVGKGYGKGHAIRGGQIIQRIARRMQLEHGDVETLRFLVLSHLKFNHVSQRRDLDDPEVARDMADEMQSPDRLKLLYVHSVCDLMAVSPEAMTEWKAQLYEACYRAAARALKGDSASPEGGRIGAGALEKEVMKYVEGRLGEKAGDDEEKKRRAQSMATFLESAPERYLQTTHPDYIAQHFILFQELSEKNRIAWSLKTGHGLSELTICSVDVPGSFSMTCGALAAKGINILSAQIYSTRDGYAMNRFQVCDVDGTPLPEGYRLERLRSDLNQVLLERTTLDELTAKYRYHSSRQIGRTRKRESEFRIDNEGSKEFSILEIRTMDRPGLLHRIAKVLDQYKLNIYRAMLATEAYGVIDVFYVTDLEYNKIHDPGAIERLFGGLKEALDGPPPEAGLESEAAPT